MDLETIFAAGWITIVFGIVILLVFATIFYAIVKKKKDYNSTGIPKQVENPDEKEGSTGNRQ